MKTLLPLNNPQSLVQLAPASGAFGNSKLVGDKQSFVDKVVGKWYCHPGNTYTLETDAHQEQAERLYDFYVEYRAVATGSSAKLWPVLKTLHQTGSIDQAKSVLTQLAA